MYLVTINYGNGIRVGCIRVVETLKDAVYQAFLAKQEFIPWQKPEDFFLGSTHKIYHVHPDRPPKLVKDKLVWAEAHGLGYMGERYAKKVHA